MSDRRHTQRPALPEGYQFGDAAKCRLSGIYGVATLNNPELVMEYDGDGNPFVRVPRAVYDALPSSWRAPHENDAAQLRRRQEKSGPVLINLCPEHPAALAFEEAIRNKTLRIVESQRTGDETI